jgi:ketosteroid isomerase-like protein
MTRRLIVGVLAALALGGVAALAQGKADGGSAALDKAKLQEVLTAWGTLDPSKAGAFYAKDAGLAFYDIAPRKYSGWAEYDKGVRDVLKETKSLTLKLGTDAQIHPSGNITWAAATVDGVMVNKDGSRMNLDGRWTSVWEKRGNSWVIVHDHFSVPLREPAPPAAAKPATAPKK